MNNAEKTIHISIAYEAVCKALDHLEEVSKANGSIGVGIISDTMPVVQAREFILSQMVQTMKGCGEVDIVEARIKIIGE